MASTTIKVSTETRDRLRAMGGDTYEDTIIDALDALDAQRFWAEAAAAATWERALPPAEQDRRRRAAAELDALFDGAD